MYEIIIDFTKYIYDALGMLIEIIQLGMEG